MKKFRSIVTNWRLVEKEYCLWLSVVEASLIEASLTIDVYIIHGYFQFLLHMWLSDSITGEDKEWEEWLQQHQFWY